MKQDKEQEYAFKDFRNAIPKKEFEIVLASVEKELQRIDKLFDAYYRFANQDINQAPNIPEQEDESYESRLIKDKFLEKLKNAFKKKAINQLENTIGMKLEEINLLVDFWNRFQTDENQKNYYES